MVTTQFARSSAAHVWPVLIVIVFLILICSLPIKITMRITIKISTHRCGRACHHITAATSRPKITDTEIVQRMMRFCLR